MNYGEDHPVARGGREGKEGLEEGGGVCWGEKEEGQEGLERVWGGVLLMLMLMLMCSGAFFLVLTGRWSNRGKQKERIIRVRRGKFYEIHLDG